MEEIKEIEKLAWIQKQMEANDNCDVIIKKRDGIIVNAVVRPLLPEIRQVFSIIYSEENLI